MATWALSPLRTEVDPTQEAPQAQVNKERILPRDAAEASTTGVPADNSEAGFIEFAQKDKKFRPEATTGVSTTGVPTISSVARPAMNVDRTVDQIASAVNRLPGGTFQLKRHMVRLLV